MLNFIKKFFEKPPEKKPQEKIPETKIKIKSETETKIKTPDEIEASNKKHGKSISNEKAIKQLFVGKCWEYLNDNFHKFSEANQIKIALEICKKDIPQEMTGTFTFNKMGEIKMGKDEALMFNIGEEKSE